MQAKRGFFQLVDVLRAARGSWPSVIAHFGYDLACFVNRHGPCPGCGGRDRFRFDDKDGEGTFICSQGGGGSLSGNGLTLLQHCTGWDFKKSLEELGSYLLRDEDRVTFGAGGLAGGVSRVSDEGPVERETLPPAPEADRVDIPPYDEAKLRAYVDGIPEISREDLRAMSPVAVEGAQASDFLEMLYGNEERVLVFTNFYSQGDFLWRVGKGGYRLAAQPGVHAVPSGMPSTGRNGVWFLVNPVMGTWEPAQHKRVTKWLPKDQHGPPQIVEVPAKVGRRSWQCVTTYRYAMIESDTAPEDLWRRLLYKLPVPIVAIYSSGGKSLHALVRVDAGGKLEWDMLVRGRNAKTSTRTMSLMDLVCPLGADPAALTAVRLSRLPCCYREGTTTKDGGYLRYGKPHLQELIYLNPIACNQPAPWRSLQMRHGSRLRHSIPA